MNRLDRRAIARRLVAAGIAAADAGGLLAAALSDSRSLALGEEGSTALVAAGKCAGVMAEAWISQAGPPDGGVLVAPVVPQPPVPGLEMFRGGHPFPDEWSVAAGTAALHVARRLTAADRLIVLLSGGASALLAVPADPVTCGEQVRLSRWLMARGVAIDALNTVRRHLSAIKGGRLAAATTASVHTFALSDVIDPTDDDPATIGSGPTVADATTFADARRVLDAAGSEWRTLAPATAVRIDEGIDGRVEETIKPGDARLARSAFEVVGNRHAAARGAAEAARTEGLDVRVRAEAVRGEARDAARQLLAEAAAHADRAKHPIGLVATGETTVTGAGPGVGGRNQELVLAACCLLRQAGRPFTVVSVGTDGIDGPTPAAGAVCDEQTWSTAVSQGLDPDAALRRHDSHTFFSAIGDTILTGPTRTNVADLTIVIAMPRVVA